MSHNWPVEFDAAREFDAFGGKSPPELLTACLLVATPRLVDPNFARRTVLIIDHGSLGALGVVLDAPGGVSVEEVLPTWLSLTTPPREIFNGGPVARNSVIGLVRMRSGATGRLDEAFPAGWTPLVEGTSPVGTIDLGARPGPATGAAVGLRLFSGYAAWAAGQLESEIAEGSWFVVKAEAQDPISPDPEGLWRRVLRRQGGPLALVSGYPADPHAN